MEPVLELVGVLAEALRRRTKAMLWTKIVAIVAAATVISFALIAGEFKNPAIFTLVTVAGAIIIATLVSLALWLYELALEALRRRPTAMLWTKIVAIFAGTTVISFLCFAGH